MRKVNEQYLNDLKAEPNKFDIAATRLHFDLDDELKNDLSNSNDKYRKLVSPVRTFVTSYGDMDRDYLKSKKISPDFVFQLAFQLAYYKMFNKYGNQKKLNESFDL